MTARPATVLLVDRDAATRELVHATLAGEHGVRLLMAEDEREALALAGRERPDVVIAGQHASQNNGFDLCRQVRELPGTGTVWFVLILDAPSDELKGAALMFGVHDFLVRPFGHADLVARVHSVLRLQRIEAELGAETLELERLHRELQESYQQLIEVLVSVMDLAIPGAADRGRHARELVMRLAVRFQVPEQFHRDLELAARLHELGRVIHTSASRAEPGAPPEPGEWQYALSTRAILAKVDGLKGVADLVGSLFENWDGTGMPDRVQAGQIPMRSRLLRVVVDLFSLMHHRPGTTMAAVIEEMRDHSGTLYDPKALVQLQALCSGGEDEVEGRTVVIPVDALRAGMMLAEDLCTDTGLKLLAANSVISTAALEAIQRRHRMEPILQGARVLRRAA